MKISELKEVLQSAIDMIDEYGYEDDEEVVMESNTYFLGNARVFLGISGYNGGYINLDEIEVEEE